MVVIRKLRHEDYHVVRSLFNDVFDMSEDAGFVKAWKERASDRTVGCWYHGGSVVGAAIVTNANLLAYIFVHPSFQNMGMGSLMLRHVLSVSKTLHLVPVDDEKIITWYRRFGFRVSNRRGRRKLLANHAHESRRTVNAKVQTGRRDRR